MKRTPFFTILICSILILTPVLVACTSKPAETLTETETTTLPATTVTETTTPPAETVTPPAITITETITVTPPPPTLNWFTPPGIEWGIKILYDYVVGVLVSCRVRLFFEVTGGSGWAEITAESAGSEMTNAFYVEEGNSYILWIFVSVRSGSGFKFIISSPSAASSIEIDVLEAQFYSFSEMNIVLRE